MHFSPNIENLKTLTKQLEESRRLIGKKEAEHSRMAIILTDNVIEILLFNYLQSAIKSDNELMSLVEPNFSREEIGNINKYFDEKLKAVKKLGIINNDSVIILKIIHSNRNSIYHRDYHNPITINKFSELYFVVATNLFRKIYDCGVSIGGDFKANWLIKYGLKINYVDFSKASDKIANYLLKGFDVSLPNIKQVLSQDIAFRLNEIKIMREREMPWLKNDIILDSSLKVAEYFDKNPYNHLSEKYNNLLRNFLKNKNSFENKASVERWKSIKLEEKQRDQTIEKSSRVFKPKTQSHILKNSSDFIEKINNYTQIDKLLEQYDFIDKSLLKIQLYLNQFFEEFDRQVQQEIDMRRGK